MGPLDNFRPCFVRQAAARASQRCHPAVRCFCRRQPDGEGAAWWHGGCRLRLHEQVGWARGGRCAAVARRGGRAACEPLAGRSTGAEALRRCGASNAHPLHCAVRASCRDQAAVRPTTSERGCGPGPKPATPASGVHAPRRAMQPDTRRRSIRWFASSRFSCASWDCLPTCERRLRNATPQHKGVSGQKTATVLVNEI